MGRRGLTVMGTVLVAAGLLSGCAGSGDSAPTAVGGLEVDAAWLDGGRLIALATWGSSTCVPIEQEVALNAGGVLEVTLTDAGPEGSTEQACTTDMVQRATLVGVPEGVDPAQDLEIEVTYASSVGDTELDGVEGLPGPGTSTEYVPSAGWIDDDGTFAFVTWGSSSCAPVIDDVQVTSETEVTVTFATPPADRVCTLDMVPRVALAVAQGVAEDAAVELVLQGEGLDGVRTPILG